MTTPWPTKLWVVRHGQSAGNVARDAAHEAQLERIALNARDVDIPLSALGEEQSRALGGWFAAMPADERLREKEFGILDGFTSRGIAKAYPEQAQFRQLLGKFYHRPPGGESWCDIILRLRSLLDTVSLHYAERRLVIVAHQVVVLCMRYILEDLDEAAILEIDRLGDVANCGVTEYRLDAAGTRGLGLERYNFTVPMEQQAVPVTRAKDAPVAARG